MPDPFDRHDYVSGDLAGAARLAREEPWESGDREDARREKPPVFVGCGFDPALAREWESMLSEAAHGGWTKKEDPSHG